jgi:hypothetical protein
MMMNSQDQTELLATVSALYERFPHGRFGQLIATLADTADRGIWDVEDRQLLVAARRRLREMAEEEAPAYRTSGKR